LTTINLLMSVVNPPCLVHHRRGGVHDGVRVRVLQVGWGGQDSRRGGAGRSWWRGEKLRKSERKRERNGGQVQKLSGCIFDLHRECEPTDRALEL
jgi:hypothetical protein